MQTEYQGSCTYWPTQFKAFYRPVQGA